MTPNEMGNETLDMVVEINHKIAELKKEIRELEHWQAGFEAFISRAENLKKKLIDIYLMERDKDGKPDN